MILLESIANAVRALMLLSDREILFPRGGRHVNPSLILLALTDDPESLSEGHRDWTRFRTSKFVSVESREERVSMELDTSAVIFLGRPIFFGMPSLADAEPIARKLQRKRDAMKR
jgi:hypothetical protein